MAPRARLSTGLSAFLGNPPLVAKAGAAALAAVLLFVGTLALTELPERGAVSPGAAAGSADGPLAAEGEVARVFAVGAPPVTVVTLRGADALEFRLQTDLTGAFAPGDFVVLHGVKQGDLVRADSIVHAKDPLRSAAPALAAGGVLAALLALDVLLPRVPERVFEAAGAVPGRLSRRLRLARRAPASPRDGGASAPDNHSGAPAPKS